MLPLSNRPAPYHSASKLDAVHTLRAVRLRLSLSAVIAPRRFLCSRSHRTDAARRSGREAISGQLLKTGLDEVPVKGERPLHAALPHYDKRNTVCQREELETRASCHTAIEVSVMVGCGVRAARRHGFASQLTDRIGPGRRQQRDSVSPPLDFNRRDPTQQAPGNEQSVFCYFGDHTCSNLIHEEYALIRGRQQHLIQRRHSVRAANA